MFSRLFPTETPKYPPPSADDKYISQFNAIRSELKPLDEDVFDSRTLLNQLCPVFYLHSKEAYFPTSVPRYTKRCQLQHQTTGEEIFALPPLTSPNFQSSYNIRGRKFYTNKDGRYFITPPTDNKAAVWRLETADTFRRSHIYGRITQVDGYYRVLYSFYFPYNEGYIVPIIQKKDDLDLPAQDINIPFVKNKYEWRVEGTHEADWEHVAFYYDIEDLKLVKARYSAHGPTEGHWIHGDELEIEDGRPVVYIARRSHACYHIGKTWFRVYGFANDECDKGHRWEPYVLDMPESINDGKLEEEINKTCLYELSTRHPDIPTLAMEHLTHEWGWLYFRGGFGNDGIGSPYYRDWWNKDPDMSVQSSFAIRFLRKNEVREKLDKLKLRISNVITNILKRDADEATVSLAITSATEDNEFIDKLYSEIKDASNCCNTTTLHTTIEEPADLFKPVAAPPTERSIHTQPVATTAKHINPSHAYNRKTIVYKPPTKNTIHIDNTRGNIFQRNFINITRK
jgi:hypothetical protein